MRLLYLTCYRFPATPWQESVTRIEVDVLDQHALIAALQGIDIVISLVGDEGVSREFGFIQAIPGIDAKLFVPSDLGLRYGKDGMAIPLIKKKEQVQEAARQAGIPLTVILIANFAGFTLGSIQLTLEYQLTRLCTYSTVEYVAAAYVSIFTTTPIAEISNRAIDLVELAPTGAEIAAALKEKHGKEPKIFQQSTERVMKEFSDRLNSDLSALAPAWYYRKLWGTGELTSLLGSDIWDLPWYKKATLKDLIVDGKVGQYRDLSRVLPYLEEAMFS
ncbi:hypothetical protein ACET3X_005794 [Alternaria dauci]|uniref:NmrA-like domain-containing protein n=1 Tax=Alternaria dauci TaxID=48095 RepID=A0ABR3UGF0_9PLEO